MYINRNHFDPGVFLVIYFQILDLSCARWGPVKGNWLFKVKKQMNSRRVHVDAWAPRKNFGNFRFLFKFIHARKLLFLPPKDAWRLFDSMGGHTSGRKSA